MKGKYDELSTYSFNPQEKSRQHGRASLQQTPTPEINQATIQRALENPNSQTLTPDIINHLQRTRGNQFVQRLISQSHTKPSNLSVKMLCRSRCTVRAKYQVLKTQCL